MTDHNPTDLAVRPAAFPVNYAVAKTALAACNKIDECKTWSDKALAIRVYAKQAKDKSLMNLATRIQARAIKRSGQMLKEAGKLSPPGKKIIVPGGNYLSPKQQLADTAGMSAKQVATATQVASVDETSFESQVESETPPSVTKLAKQGKKKRSKKKPAPTNPDFQVATHMMGSTYTCAETCAKCDPSRVRAGLKEHEVQAFSDALRVIMEWKETYDKS